MAPATLEMPLPPFQRSFNQTTAISTIYVVYEKLPVETFEFKKEEDMTFLGGLDWMSLTKIVLPDTRPLAPEERSSLNEFFWSHFR